VKESRESLSFVKSWCAPGLYFRLETGIGKARSFISTREGTHMGIPSDSAQAHSSLQTLKLKSLNLEQVRHIDQVLASLGDYGEVHLIVQRGELRYINRVESFKVWKSEPKK
jgi:hypothetical protein